MTIPFHGHGIAEPIGLEYIAGSLRRAGFTTAFRSYNELEAWLPGQETRVSLFSAVTHMWPSVVVDAHAAKRRGNRTIVGGYHACSVWRSMDRGPFDFVVAGEGENVVSTLVSGVLGNGDAPSEMHADVFVRTDAIEEIDALPNPVRDVRFLDKYRLFDVMWPPPSLQRRTALVLFSRGCARDCGFCSSKTVWGTRVRLRSVDSIVGELKGLKQQFDTNTIVIIDQSFGQDTQWSLDVCKGIQEAKLGMNWYHQSNLTIDKDVIRAMADAGCTKIGFGVEGLSPSAAKKVKPVHPHDFGYVNDLFDYCTSLGLFVKAYLMLGFPWETEEVISEYFEWLPRLRTSQVRICYMTPFPGTAYWERYSDQLISEDWSDFDTVRMPVVRNPNISVSRYAQIHRDLFHVFYGSEEYAKEVETMIERFPHYSQSYREFCKYLSLHGMITGKEEWLDCVKDGRRETSSLAVNQPS